MAAFVFDSKSSSGFDFSGFSDPYCCSIGPVGGFSEVSRGGSGSGSGFVSQSLVLDCERDELVKAPAKVVKKGVSEVKASMALKSHSEAERRRRERINGHLDTLRHILPCTEKMDKATLLAEVIAQLKELQKNAIETTKDLLVPMDTDEVRVEPYNNEAGDQDRDRDQGRTCFFKASLCCETSPELLKDLRQAVDSIHLRIIKSEISTLGNRSINVFIFAKESASNDPEELQVLADAIREALTSVLEKSAASLEYSPRFGYPSKKRRISYLDSSSSCS